MLGAALSFKYLTVFRFYYEMFGALCLALFGTKWLDDKGNNNF